jgi:hypothetical protein
MNNLPPFPDYPISAIAISFLKKFAKKFAVKGALLVLTLAANLPPVLMAPGVTSFLIFSVVVVTTAAYRIE